MLKARSNPKITLSKKSRAAAKGKKKYVRFTRVDADLNDVVRGGKRFVGPSLLDAHLSSQHNGIAAKSKLDTRTKAATQRSTHKVRQIRVTRVRGDLNDVICDGKPYIGRSMLDYKPAKR